MCTGNSLVVQWLRLCASAVGSMGLIPVCGTETPRAVPPGSHHVLSPLCFLLSSLLLYQLPVLHLGSKEVIGCKLDFQKPLASIPLFDVPPLVHCPFVLSVALHTDFKGFTPLQFCLSFLMGRNMGEGGMNKDIKRRNRAPSGPASMSILFPLLSISVS